MDRTGEAKIIASLDALHDVVGRLEERMVTRDEFHTTLDEVLTVVRRLDQERLFTVEWVRRIEHDVERVKKHLHLA